MAVELMTTGIGGETERGALSPVLAIAALLVVHPPEVQTVSVYEYKVRATSPQSV